MIFDPSPTPRVFGLPPGADYAAALLRGLRARLTGQPAEAIARVEIFVNTGRMMRRLVEMFDQGPASLLPRIRLITDLALDPAVPGLPAPVSGLRRRLELSQFVLRLIEAQPDLAPRTALFDLSDSLARLMEEMQGEGVSPAAIAGLDVGAHSAHWARTQAFLGIIGRYFGEGAEPPDAAGRLRQVIAFKAAGWAADPPRHPVLVAGSTGSRGATALLISAVARLPQGAVILPGFDFDQPDHVWQTMTDALHAEDHPQFRFRKILDRLGLAPGAVDRWDETPPPCAARNALVSLALRPAPVTDQWRREGPHLPSLALASSGLTLIEAPSLRAEAAAIALRLRQAVDEGKRAALITPDRGLTRMVAAALDQWQLQPDDSGGLPLAQSVPGRFLRQVADLPCSKLTSEALLSLLKHPLACASDRGPHLLRVRELELDLRRNGPPFPDPASLTRWAERTAAQDPGRRDWAAWVAGLCCGLHDRQARPLADWVTGHLARATALAAGPGATGAGALWDEAAGREARKTCDLLQRDADAGGDLLARDYAALFFGLLDSAEVRNPDIGHPQVLIWGTLEARVQGADLVILAGLNEGTWPEAPAPDPWLNRAMRHDCGLLLPDRQIGLAAHDFQQAVAGAEVWLSRSKRSEQAETVPSRWLMRLTNLLRGLPAQGGDVALDQMQARGEMWVSRALALSDPALQDPPLVLAPATRPSPRPPLPARPSRLSVTEIETLIRDPFAIFARRVLRLAPLDPLTAQPDPPLRGTILHRVMERFVAEGIDPAADDARARLIGLAQAEMAAQCPWPTARQIWLGRFDRQVDRFLHDEADRRLTARPVATETAGTILLAGRGLTLSGKADRIDRTEAGQALLYDYKTGTPPTAKQQLHYAKQLLLQAAMIERGAYAEVGALQVVAAAYLALSPGGETVMAPLDKLPPDQVWAEFDALIGKWQDYRRGYSAHIAAARFDRASDYDHLSRHGEWDISDPVAPEDLA